MQKDRRFDILIESLIVFLVVFSPLAFGSVHPWAIAVFEVTAVLMALVWLLKMNKDKSFTFISSPLTLIIFLFVSYVSLQLFLSILISYPSSIAHRPSTIYFWATRTELLKIISYALIFFVTLNTIKTSRQITRILSVIITMGFIMGIFYLMRYFGAQAPQGLINPDHFSGYLGMIIPLSLGLLFVARPAFDIRHRIVSGASLIQSTGRQTLPRVLLFFCTIVMGAALFFTMSRGGMFSFMAALMIMAVLVSGRRSIKQKGWILSCVALFLVLTIAWLGATPVIERLLSIKVEVASRYFGGRLPIWEGAVGIIKDHPLFGTGLGTFNTIFPKYQPLEIMARHYTYAHSNILELLCETGIPFFALSVVCGLWTVVHLLRRFNARHDPWVIGLSIGLFGSLAAITIHSFADFNLHVPANAIYLTIILSLFLSIINLEHDPKVLSCRISRGARVLFSPIFVFLLGFLILMAVRPALADYYFRRTALDGRGPWTRDRGLLHRAIALDPSNADYYFHLGKAYSRQSATVEGSPEHHRRIGHQLSAYKRAVELNPTNSKYHQSLAWTYGISADLDRRPTTDVRRLTNLAHRHFQEAIRLEPNNAYRHRAYAIWLFTHPTQENIEKGVQEYRRAVDLAPALAEEALDKYSKLQKNYSRLIAILPRTEKSDAIFLRYLLVEENIDYAMQFAERFLKSYKENAECYFWIADKASYDKAYEWDFIKAYYLKSLELDPDNAFYRYWYAVNLAYRKDRIEADKQFNLIIQSHPAYSEEIKDFRLKNY